MERKRKVSFSDDNESVQTMKKLKKSTNNSTNIHLHHEKYTLDNDEEEQDNSKAMNQDHLEDIGQKRMTIGSDDEIRITPIHIDEEMEEGHNDQTGCFQWKKKDKDEIHDVLLDDIKNYELKNSQITKETLVNLLNNNLLNNDDDDDDELNNNQFNEFHALKSLLAIMQPNETVVRAIKRLGAAAISNKSKQRIKQRKPRFEEMLTTLSVELTPEESKMNKLLLEEITGLADQFVSNGQLDIYQETYEQIQTKLNRIQPFASSTTDNPRFKMYNTNNIVLSFMQRINPQDSSNIL